ncbi:MAG: hypothetical protein IKW49_08015 [Opitutales bacterium]|nr:hypothetical protein [Opitutales bacterium]
MNLKTLFVSVFATLICCHEAFAFQEEAINKNLWLNTNGHLGALPGEKPKNPQPTRYQSDFDNYASDNYVSGDYVSEIGIDAFFAESDFGGFKDDPDFYGLKMSYLVRNHRKETVSPEFFISGGLGFGYGEHSEGEKDNEYGVTHFMGTLGANLRYNVTPDLSFYVGVRMGGEIVLFFVDDGEESHDCECDFGVIYGIGMGCNLTLSENVSMHIGIEHVTSEADSSIHGITLESQSYHIYSLGFTIAY